MGFMWIGGFLVMVLFVWFLITLIRPDNNRPVIKRDFTEPESPLDILKSRYAKGEITKDEFDKMRKDLV